MKIIILVVMVLSFNVNAEQKYNAEGHPIDEEGYVIMDGSANDAYMDNDPNYEPEPYVPVAEYESVENNRSSATRTRSAPRSKPRRTRSKPSSNWRKYAQGGFFAV